MFLSSRRRRWRRPSHQSAVRSIVHVVDVDFVKYYYVLSNYFFFLGEPAAAFLVLGAAFAVFGFGAFGFFVGPALLDFFALDGDLGDFPAGEDAAAALAFFSAAVAAADVVFLDFAAAAAFFSVAVTFLALPAAVAAFLPAAPAPLALGDLSAALLAVDFLAFGDDAEPPPLFLSDPEEADEFAPDDLEPAPDVANLKEPEAPLPFV